MKTFPELSAARVKFDCNLFRIRMKARLELALYNLLHMMTRTCSRLVFAVRYGVLSAEILYFDLCIAYVTPAKQELRRLAHLPAEAFGNWLLGQRPGRQVLAWIFTRPIVRRAWHKQIRDIRERRAVANTHLGRLCARHPNDPYFIGVAATLPERYQQQIAALRDHEIPTRDNSGEIEDRYAASVIRDREDDYGALEIHGVRDVSHRISELGADCAIDDDNPQFYSVYARLHAGGVDCVGDFSKYTKALGYAEDLRASYGWPITDYTCNRRAAA